MSVLNEEVPFGKVSDDWRTPTIVEWERYLSEVKLEVDDPKLFSKVHEDFVESGAAHALSEKYESVKPIPVMPGDKGMFYVLMSALQKAVRFGLEEDAIRYYRSLVKSGFDAQIRTRLRTIVYEDIGVADPFICSLVMELTTSSTMVPVEMIEAVIVLMCQTDKSRIQTDMWQALTFRKKGTYEEEFTKAAMKPIDGPMTVMEAFMLALMLRGPKNKDLLPGKLFPKANPKLLRELIKRLNAPTLYRRMIEECLVSAIPFHAALIPTTAVLLNKPVEYRSCPFPKIEHKYIEKTMILEAALDQHTSNGKRAMAYVLKSTPELMPPDHVLENVPKLDILGHAIFRVEGAWLHNNMSNDVFDDMWAQSMIDCWKVEGWKTPSEAEDYYKLVMENMDRLSHARNRIWS